MVLVQVTYLWLHRKVGKRAVFVSECVTVFTEYAERISFTALRWFCLNRYAYLASISIPTYTLGFKF